ncbi:MAG: C4-type zinc ribbon domain-containing protein [Candidatus Eisenbacteria bacterium]
MKEQIGKLLRLQAVDRRLRELEKDLAELPEHLREAKEALAEREAELGAVKGEVEKAILAQKATEGELEKNTEQIRKYNRQLFEVKNNKEYTALRSEIEGLGGLNSELETKVLTEMERIDDLRAAKEEAAKKVGVAEEEVRKAERRAKVEGEEIGDLVEKARAEREEAARGIDRSILARYDTIRAGKGGVALAKIERDACEICFRSVPPQRIIEVKKSNRVIPCEGCGRILVWVE